MKRRVLFVDDEPNVLDGLRNRLHRQRDRWELLFADSGEAALALLAREPVDVIVSDLRMPRMDGATLLEHVRTGYPHVVRIVLSGHAEFDTAMRAVTVAHQFMTKPSEPGVIENVVDRACRLQSFITDDRIRQIVCRVDHLPSMPRVYAQLKAALTSEHVSAGVVAGILKRDMAICAKTLQMVNSAFFRLSRVIVEIEEAVVYLGFRTILQITLAVEVFEKGHGGRHPVVGVSLEELQAHAVLVGQVASNMFADKQAREDAFVVGLLHDIGKLVLAVEMQDWPVMVAREMAESHCPAHEAERQLCGVTHAEVGGYLLGLWGLPYPVIEAVANHHAPWNVGPHDLGMLAATYIANGLVHDHLDGADSSLDLSYLERLGVSERLPAWREMAAREIRNSGDAGGEKP